MKTKQQMFHLYKITSKISLQHHPLKVTRMLRLNHQKVNKHKHEALTFQPFGQMTKPDEKHQAFFLHKLLLTLQKSWVKCLFLQKGFYLPVSSRQICKSHFLNRLCYSAACCFLFVCVFPHQTVSFLKQSHVFSLFPKLGLTHCNWSRNVWDFLKLMFTEYLYMCQALFQTFCMYYLTGSSWKIGYPHCVCIKWDQEQIKDCPRSRCWWQSWDLNTVFLPSRSVYLMTLLITSN